MIPRSVSVFDLARQPGAVGVIQRNSKEEIDNLLWQLGFDTKYGYEFNDCWHRPLSAKTNEPQYGVRIEGVERSDQEWLESPHSSWEAKTENIDVSLRDDLISLGQQSNFTDSIIKHISGGQKGEE